MPTDETRRLLRLFGMAVTNYEDAVNSGAPPEKLRETESEARSHLKEIEALMDRLGTAAKKT